MLDLYFAGQVTDHVDKCLFDMGANHLFSYLNERKNINRWIGWINQYGRKGKLFIDSGAFTAWTKGTYINVDDYVYFLNDRVQYIDLFGQLDCIPGNIRQKPTQAQVLDAAVKTWKNYLYMRDAVLNKDGLLYTFHVGEPIWCLRRALEWRDENGQPLKYIAFGGMVGKPKDVQKNFLSLCFDIIKSSSNPNVKIHAFGMTVRKTLVQYPVTSADSSSWIQSGHNGAIYTPWGTIIISAQQKDKMAHPLNGSAVALEDLKSYIKSKNFDFEQLMEDYVQRDLWNVTFLMDWAKEYTYHGGKIIRRRLF